MKDRIESEDSDRGATHRLRGGSVLLALLTALAGCDSGATANSRLDRAPDAERQTGARLSEQSLTINLRENEIASTREHGYACVDPVSGRIAWRALTCTNLSCVAIAANDRGLVFTVPIPHAQIGADHRVDLPSDAQMLEYSKIHYRCPECGSKQWIQQYVPYEVAQRRRQLEEELAAARRARRTAMRSGTAAPTGPRTPVAIMRDLAELPSLYVLPD